MFINSILCPYEVKTESKCNRLFRPWDSMTCCTDNSQDSTVSTTTLEDVQEHKKYDDLKTSSTKTDSNKEGFRPLNKKPLIIQNTECTSIMSSKHPQQGYLDPYSGVHTDPANLLHSLSVPHTDPLLLESMVQGFALEEYARVLNQEHQAKLLAAKKQRPKKYKCPHCDVGFSNNGQLKGHIRIHTGERPFKCEEKDCGKTFTRNEELTRHKRIHSGLRPFPCTHCGKRFGRKDHLKKHSRTHFQPKGIYAVPVMLPYDTWASGSSTYPFIPMIGY